MTAGARSLAVVARGPRRGRARGGPLVVLGAATVTLLCLMAFVGPLLMSGPVAHGTPFEAPSVTHPLGTDDLGQDLLALLLLGGRTSLAVVLAAAIIATALGGTLGLAAGLAGGRVDQALARVLDVMLALPFLPLVIVVGAFLGQGAMGVALLIGVAWSAHIARVVRSQALEARSRSHVEHARAMGASYGWVARRHLLPIVTPLLVPLFARAAGAALIAEASITFLGLGDPTVPSWGGTIAFGQARGALLSGAWLWWVVPPGVCIALVVSGLALLGFGLEERSQPRVARWDTRPAPTTAAAVVPVDPSDALVEARGLRVAVATDDQGSIEIVRSIDLVIKTGEALGILGASGSGKTTLAMTLVGLGAGRVMEGSVLLMGRDLTSLPPDELRSLRGDRIGIVPQDAMQALDPVQPVDRQVAEVVRAHRSIDRGRALGRARAALARVGLTAGQQRAFPHQLSGGMRQRVVIAMALVNDPALLVADEPTTGLDVVAQSGLIDLLAALREERDLALLIVSHDLPTVARLADRVLVLDHGRVVRAGPVDEVLGRPPEPGSSRVGRHGPADTGMARP